MAQTGPTLRRVGALSRRARLIRTRHSGPEEVEGPQRKDVGPTPMPVAITVSGWVVLFISGKLVYAYTDASQTAG